MSVHKKQASLISNLQVMKQRYERGENVIQYLKGIARSDMTSDESEAIAISYDLQAGAYSAFADQHVEYKQNQAQSLARILGQLGIFRSIVEAGVGEATTLAYLLTHLGQKPIDALGFDVSWSRIRFGRAFSERFSHERVSLCVGDLFSIPLLDDSIDVVYTFHSIEPNGGREEGALQELYRVARDYIVLCEPAFDLADLAARERMKSHGFACDIYPTAVRLGFDIVEHRLFDVCFNPLNPTGITIIRKRGDERKSMKPWSYACPITRTPLEKYDDCYFSKESLLAYPIIADIPCLLPRNAIIATHLAEFKSQMARK